jgi:very-short-patch-repair endonuclease
MQRGVIATWQAPEVGMSIRQLRRASTTGWQELSPRTILSSPDIPTSRQLRVAGILESGPDAALTGCSALIESRWSGDDAGWVDVVVARDHRSRRVRTPGWLRVHSTLEVPRAGGTPTRVDPARATIDAAAWARTSRERLFIVTSAAQQRLVTTAQLRRELSTRGRIAWSTEIREILESIDVGVTSTSEADFLRACRSRGLLAPRMQVRRVAGGRRRRVDAEFRLPDGRVLMVEIDGVAHMDVRQWEADLIRQNELTAETGALVLHVTGWQIRHDPDEFFDLLRRLGVR